MLGRGMGHIQGKVYERRHSWKKREGSEEASFSIEKLSRNFTIFTTGFEEQIGGVCSIDRCVKQPCQKAAGGQYNI